MEKININSTDLWVSKINFGGNVFGWTVNEAQSFELLDAIVAAGINFIDTADIYSWWAGTPGISETIIGKWMKSRNNRDKIVLATKVGGQSSMESGINVSNAYIHKTLEESLQRLQTDYIDLYYTHFDDNTTPVSETLSAYDTAIKEGKVRYIGASNLSPERLTTSLQLAKEEHLPKYVALQPHYNLIERAVYESQYAPIVAEHELTVFPYYALASGFLTGKYRSKADISKSVRGGGVEKYLNEKGSTLLSCLDAIAAKHDTTPTTVSLAWLLQQPRIGAPIVSATQLNQLDAMIQASTLELDDADKTALNKASL